MHIRTATVFSALLAASTAGSAMGDIQYFNNADGGFVWRHSYDLAGFHHGTSLDPTLPPSQSGDESPSAFLSYIEPFFTSGQLVTVSIRTPMGGNIRIAREGALYIEAGPYSRDVYPAVSFAPGEEIDADAGIGTWETIADTSYRQGINGGSLIGGHAFVGFRTELADGIHFGWIELIDEGYHGSLLPIAWAWETTPGTPIGAGVIPAPAPAVLLGCLAFIPRARQRRSSPGSCRE